MRRRVDPFTVIATALCALMVLFLSTVVPWRLVASPGHTTLASLEPVRLAGPWLIAVGASGYLFCLLNFLFVAQGPPLPGFDPPNLMVNGLYRYVRNPMYLSWFLVLLGEALWFRSRDLLVYLGFWCLFFHAKVVLFEEPALRAKFGEAYRQYCGSVPRWLPRLRAAGARRTRA